MAAGMGKSKILIIEDDRGIAEMIEYNLEEEGVQDFLGPEW